MSYVGNTNTTQAFTPAVDYFSGNGSTVAFTLSRPVASVAQVQAVVNNVPQNPTDAFTVLNNTITFTSAPSSGTNNIYVQYTSPITQVAALPQSPQVFGNLQFSGTGQRITGDFSNATLANRVFFQNSVINGASDVAVIPNGTSQAANFTAFGSSSDQANTTLMRIGVNSTETLINSFRTGTGTYLPMTFYTGGSERMRVDTSGNVGIGTSSPSAAKLVVRSGTGTAHTVLGNDYGSLYLETASGGPNRITSLNSGLSAGQALAFNGSGGTEWGRFDSSGNLLVGTTSFSSGGISRTLAINGASSAAVQFQIGGALASYVYAYTSAGFRCETSSTYPRVEFVPGASGGVQLASAGATSWTSLSDERTKTDLTPITNAAAKVSSLRAVTGRFKTDSEETRRSFLIAQDVQAVLPEAVSLYRVKDDDTDYLGLSYTDTIPLLVAAIKEQQAIITALTARVTALESK